MKMISSGVMKMLLFSVFICATVKDALLAITVDIDPKNEVVVKEGGSCRILCDAGEPIERCSVKIPSLEGERFLTENETGKDGLSYFGEGFEKGQCGVEMKYVKKEFEGFFECNLLPLEAQEDSSATTNIIIAKKPHVPELIVLGPGQNGQNNYTANDKINISCRAASGRPPANLSLYIDDDLIHFEYQVSPYNGNDTIAEAKATRNLEWTDHGKALRCVSNHLTLDKQGITVTRQLSVQYAPTKEEPIWFKNITMGQERSINIIVKANPEPVFTWIINKERITAGKSDDNDRIQTDPPKNLGNGFFLLNLKFVTVEKEDIDKTFVLEANNSLGRELYPVTLSGSEAPQGGDMDIESIIGIRIGVPFLILIVWIAVFARATGRWCFKGSSTSRNVGESSETERAVRYSRSEDDCDNPSRTHRIKMFLGRLHKRNKDTVSGADTDAIPTVVVDHNKVRNPDDPIYADTTVSAVQDPGLVYAELN